MPAIENLSNAQKQVIRNGIGGHSVWANVCSTVADLQAYPNGSVVTTLGYYSPGDGGGNSYIYRTSGRSEITIDEGFYINGVGEDDYFEAVDKTVADVLKFGGTAEDIGPAFNRALSAVGTTCSVVNLPFGQYTVQTRIDLPISNSASVLPHFLTINGNGSRLTASGVDAVFRRVVSNNSNANLTITSKVPVFDDIEVHGNNEAIGFDIGATYGLKFNNCHARNCTNGYRLAFCLMARIDHCFATLCTQRSLLIMDASTLWDNATFNNSSSNATQVSNFRSFISAPDVDHIEVRNSDSVTFKNIITEGNRCRWALTLSIENTTSKQWVVENHHAENTKGLGIYNINVAHGGQFHVRYLDTTHPGYLYAGSHAGGLKLFMSHVPYIANWEQPAWDSETSYTEQGTYYSHNGSVYQLTGTATIGQSPSVDTSNWTLVGDSAIALHNTSGQLYYYRFVGQEVNGTLPGVDQLLNEHWGEFSNAVHENQRGANGGVYKLANNKLEFNTKLDLGLNSYGRDVLISAEDDVVISAKDDITLVSNTDASGGGDVIINGSIQGA